MYFTDIFPQPTHFFFLFLENKILLFDLFSSDLIYLFKNKKMKKKSFDLISFLFSSFFSLLVLIFIK